MEYHHYTSTDFALDDYFFKWVVQADESSENFWTVWLEQHPYKEREVVEARRWILVLQTEFNKAEIKQMPHKDQIWKRIVAHVLKESNAQEPENS
ncbi:hypothetical protein [Catalinimonas niigatensis]|uniref:hypothetical protein n=1 Tax=Catalinimonas niigatensis TaxID=1397264 RepID=UPI0026665CBE|nr:hypothetical protein [Catalinimonas niigatensis]WPP52700.1 hypothetical protein PZB72_09940 [Catalinimonas niigatensis]